MRISTLVFLQLVTTYYYIIIKIQNSWIILILSYFGILFIIFSLCHFVEVLRNSNACVVVNCYYILFILVYFKYGKTRRLKVCIQVAEWGGQGNISYTNVKKCLFAELSHCGMTHLRSIYSGVVVMGWRHGCVLIGCCAQLHTVSWLGSLLMPLYYFLQYDSFCCVSEITVG